MVFLFKRENKTKKGTKIRTGYACMGCNVAFRSRRGLEAHQGDFWPYCPPVDNSTSKENKGGL